MFTLVLVSMRLLTKCLQFNKKQSKNESISLPVPVFSEGTNVINQDVFNVLGLEATKACLCQNISLLSPASSLVPNMSYLIDYI